LAAYHRVLNPDSRTRGRQAAAQWIGTDGMAATAAGTFDGLAIARARIAEEARARTGSLDLCNLGLKDLPADLFNLRHLRVLYLGDRVRRDDGEWDTSPARGPANEVEGALKRLSGLSELRELSLAGSRLEDLGAVAGLSRLRELDCARTQVTDLAPLARMSGLRSFDCSGTQVSDLAPLGKLTGMESVTCSYTPVSSLAPLAELSGIRHIDCSSTDVESLEVLARIKSLRRLDCSYTRVRDLEPLTGLGELQHLACASITLTNLALVEQLRALQRFDCSYTDVDDLSPLANIAGLQWVHCSGTRVEDLAPLTALAGLQVLFCTDTLVRDLAPLGQMKSLRALECSHSRVSTLAPLGALPMLQVLHCTGTEISDLGPLSAITPLQVLYCSSTQVSSLAPLTRLSALQVLACAHTGISDLGPIAGLAALRELSCADTRVTDLTPLAGLPALQWFSCAETQVSDLSPLTGKPALRWVSFASSAVADLTPVAAMPALEWLDGSDCRLNLPPAEVTRHAALRELFTYRSTMEQVPAEVLSQSKRDNCLPALRAHFRDLEDGAEAVPDVKLVILGNGRVGKTQLSRKLRDEEFQHHWDSTHGISVRPGDLAQADGGTAAKLQIWDFGGQDIYHGTHTLFLRTRAVFVLAWAEDVESTPEYEHQGIRFRNHPLAYWVEYVRQFGDRDSPVLIVQTKCDNEGDGAATPPVPEEALRQFGFLRVIRYSSANDRGRAELDAAMCEAIDWLRRPERQGAVSTGAGRARVRRRLEALRDEDAARPAAERRHRTLERDEFQRICDDVGGIASADHLLSYLNNAGVIFFRKGLFGDRIILDQAWALDAIYAVFQRDRCYRQLQERQGRFNRALLEELVWRDYSVAEQRLFLSMMVSCGICFVHRPGADGQDAAEYIAPELLGERATVEGRLDAWKGDGLASEEEIFSYRLLPPGLLRGLIARIGAAAGTNAVYWRDGVAAYETSLRSHAVIVQEQDREWGGRLRVWTQGGDAAALLKRLADWVDEEHARAGIDPDDVGRSSSRPAELEDDLIGAASIVEKAKQSPLVFGPAPGATGG